MILWNDAKSMEEALLSFPATADAIKQNKAIDRVFWTNDDAGELFNSHKLDVIRIAMIPHAARYIKLGVS